MKSLSFIAEIKSVPPLFLLCDYMKGQNSKNGVFKIFII